MIGKKTKCGGTILAVMTFRCYASYFLKTEFRRDIEAIIKRWGIQSENDVVAFLSFEEKILPMSEEEFLENYNYLKEEFHKEWKEKIMTRYMAVPLARLEILDDSSSVD